MKIYGLLNENHIFFDLKSESKRALLEEFVNALKTRGLVKNEKLVLAELFAREDLCSTGLEKGIAVPHALTSEIEDSFLALAVIKNGVDFGSVDQMPTYILLLLLGNNDKPGNQLKILAHICRLVKDTDFVEKVKKADSPQDVCVILEEEEGRIA